MELWFIAAVAGTVLSGFSNFTFKVAAVRGYNSSLFSIYGGCTSVVLVSLVLLIQPEPLFDMPWWAVGVFLTGMTAGVAGILKVYALRYIDSTIYFPLFKLLAPLLAIVAGVSLFGERFSAFEWIGLVAGLLVPLLLITRTEDSRQNNLFLGLVLVVIGGILSAFAAVVHKYAIDASMTVTVTLWFTVAGVLAGSLLTMAYRTGLSKIISSARVDSSRGLFLVAALRSVLIASSVWLTLFAFSVEGTLAVVQTIISMYILIPIVLAIIFYNEHWNAQKVIAITLSVASLALLG